MAEAAVVGYRPGPEAPVVPLILKMEVCETPENVRRNLAASMARPYVRFNEWLDRESGACSIVGSGPSLKRTWRDLVGDVIACNGALGFLLERGIVPKYAMFFDAAEIVARFARRHEDVTYLVASRCHPAVFEALAGLRVVTWHVKGDEPIDEMLGEANRMEPMIHGGSAAVTRTMLLAHAMGYREQHWFGADSSCDDDGETHAGGSLVEEKPLRVMVARQWFDTTPWLAGQVEDFKILAPELRNWGSRIVVHGTGLLPHVAGVMGFEVIGDNPQPLEGTQ